MEWDRGLLLFEMKASRSHIDLPGLDMRRSGEQYYRDMLLQWGLAVR